MKTDIAAMRETIAKMTDYELDDFLVLARQSGKVIIPKWYLFEDMKETGITEEQFALASASDEVAEIVATMLGDRFDEIAEIMRTYQPNARERLAYLEEECDKCILSNAGGCLECGTAEEKARLYAKVAAKEGSK